MDTTIDMILKELNEATLTFKIASEKTEAAYREKIAALNILNKVQRAFDDWTRSIHNTAAPESEWQRERLNKNSD